MSLPELTATGDLPPGVYQSTIEEVERRFGSDSAIRRILLGRLLHAFDLANRSGCLKRFIVFGSFITEKHEPNDVDVFMLMADDFTLNSLTSEQAVLFDHREADLRLGISAFWLRSAAALGSEEEAVAFWQTKRDGTKRGIVEIVETNE